MQLHWQMRPDDHKLHHYGEHKHIPKGCLGSFTWHSTTRLSKQIWDLCACHLFSGCNEWLDLKGSVTLETKSFFEKYDSLGFYELPREGKCPISSSHQPRAKSVTKTCQHRGIWWKTSTTLLTSGSLIDPPPLCPSHYQQERSEVTDIRGRWWQSCPGGGNHQKFLSCRHLVQKELKAWEGEILNSKLNSGFLRKMARVLTD